MTYTKFGIDARCLEWQRGGVARILITLLQNWLTYDDNIHYILYFQNYIPDDKILYNSKITCKIIPGPNILKNRRIIAEQILFPFILFTDKLDYFFAPWYSAPIFLPNLKLFVGAWDISYSTHPSHYKFFDRLSLSIFSRLACKRANGVLTCSKFDSVQINKFFSVLIEKIHVFRLSADIKFSKPASNYDLQRVKTKFNLPSNFLLSLGVIYSRRNIDIIIDSFEKLNNNGFDLKLVVVGKNATCPFIDIESKVNNSKFPQKIRYIRWIEEEDLLPLYQLAYAYICTSTVDGETILLKEAMMSGLPVISSPLLEEAIGYNCITINDPHNIDETCAAISVVFNNLFNRNELIKRGINYLKTIDHSIESKLVYDFIISPLTCSP